LQKEPRKDETVCTCAAQNANVSRVVVEQLPIKCAPGIITCKINIPSTARTPRAAMFLALITVFSDPIITKKSFFGFLYSYSTMKSSQHFER
jgi:hypothetical protein